MKLVRLKVEYTSGLTVSDRVSVDSTSGEILLPPRLAVLLDAGKDLDVSPAISLEYEGYVLPVSIGENGVLYTSMPASVPPGFKRVIHSLVYPTKDQRQQNGRFLQTLSAASFVGSVGYGHAALQWNVQTILGTVILFGFGVASWYVGFLSLKGD
jgi:hypothetical protein